MLGKHSFPPPPWGIWGNAMTVLRNSSRLLVSTVILLFLTSLISHTTNLNVAQQTGFVELSKDDVKNLLSARNSGDWSSSGSAANPVVINSVDTTPNNEVVIAGLISGSMIVIFLTINGEFHYLLPIIGTLTAFLYFNWYPSKIFMGDAGSLYLGTYLTSLMYSSPGITSNFKILLLCSPLFLDAFICITRRLINKKNIFKAHKSHLYQRLVSNGLKHSVVASIYISAIALLSLFYLFSTTLNLFLKA